MFLYAVRRRGTELYGNNELSDESYGPLEDAIFYNNPSQPQGIAIDGEEVVAFSVTEIRAVAAPFRPETVVSTGDSG